MLKRLAWALALYYLTFAAIISANELPPLSLAKRYSVGVDLHDYLISEKLDGVRGYWDGKRLLTRTGNIINAPKWFTRGWPRQALDGELWIGRGQFEALSSIVRQQQANDEQWQRVSFKVFDLHNAKQGFEQRYQQLQQLLAITANSSISLIAQRAVADQAELERWLKQVIDIGGEGLMLHKRNALYRVGRSDDVLKLKPEWDAEARVIDYLPGKGKYQGQLGALLVKPIVNDVEPALAEVAFAIGSGLADTDRAKPPPIGAVIRYRYSGLTRKGVPRFARYLRLQSPQ